MSELQKLIQAIRDDDVSREELRDMAASMTDAADPAAEQRSRWDEVPGHPLADWRYEVGNEDTMLGYAEWCAARDEDGGDA